MIAILEDGLCILSVLQVIITCYFNQLKSHIINTIQKSANFLKHMFEVSFPQKKENLII